MKPLIWIAMGVLALAWTGLAALGAALLGWVADSVATSHVAGREWAAQPWTLPAWAPPWLDPAWAGLAQERLVDMLGLAGPALPVLGQAIGWLVPLVWIGWGLGLALLLGLAWAGQKLAGRLRPRVIAA